MLTITTMCMHEMHIIERWHEIMVAPPKYEVTPIIYYFSKCDEQVILPNLFPPPFSIGKLIFRAWLT